MPSRSRLSSPRALLGNALVVLGLGLLAFMVTVEGEPGALPLLLIVLGVAVRAWTLLRP